MLTEWFSAHYTPQMTLNVYKFNYSYYTFMNYTM